MSSPSCHDFRSQKSTLKDDSGDSEDGTEDGAVTEYAFPELDAHIRAVIDEYGGAVFPKLNFSSPKVRSF
jgi:hypothetical protein